MSQSENEQMSTAKVFGRIRTAKVVMDSVTTFAVRYRRPRKLENLPKIESGSHVGDRSKNSQKMNFLADFAPLEHALASGVSCPIERMIVELKLTPQRVAKMETAGYAGSFDWFPPAYLVMCRHGLLGRGLNWDQWLKEYCSRRQALLKNSASKSVSKRSR